MDNAQLERSKVAEIARLLSAAGWEPLDKHEQKTDRFYINLLPLPARIFIAGPYWGSKGRITIHGNYPSYTDSQGHDVTIYPREVWVDNVRQSAPEITCGVERTAEQIAKDIERRFLPEFVRVWNLCNDRAQLYQRQVLAKHDICARVAQLTGGSAYREDKGVGFDRGEVSYIDSDGLLTVKLEDVTEAELARILKARKA